MTTFASIKKSREVMDVLCCLILGKNNVKDLVKHLKQPQPTISGKLKFLIKHKVVLKDKWLFVPNWVEITKLVQTDVRQYFVDVKDFLKRTEVVFKYDKKQLADTNRVLNKINNIFNEQRVTLLFQNYAGYLLDGVMRKMSIGELVYSYIYTLRSTDTAEFKQFTPDISVIKRYFDNTGIRNMKEQLFFDTEHAYERNRTERRQDIGNIQHVHRTGSRKTSSRKVEEVN